MLENLTKEKKEEYVDSLIDNLPALRAKMGISQSELADMIGIGRQTLISLENKKGRLKWDTFLALVMVFSNDRDASGLLKLLGLHLQDIETKIQDDILVRKGVVNLSLEKIWTDSNLTDEVTLRGIVPLPIGLKSCKCPKCQSRNVRGAIIMPTADEQDPNIICLDCGFWWD